MFNFVAVVTTQSDAADQRPEQQEASERSGKVELASFLLVSTLADYLVC